MTIHIGRSRNECQSHFVLTVDTARCFRTIQFQAGALPSPLPTR